MNGGKDVKIGHDKRPVSVVPSDEQPLYNIANGEVLTDEFGNPLITEVDQFFLQMHQRKINIGCFSITIQKISIKLEL